MATTLAAAIDSRLARDGIIVERLRIIRCLRISGAAFRQAEQCPTRTDADDDQSKYKQREENDQE